MPEVLSFRSPSPTARKRKRRILSARTLRALMPSASGSVEYFDDMTPGLSLRITANDVRTWTLFHRDKNGRQKRLTLKRYSKSRNLSNPTCGFESRRGRQTVLVYSGDLGNRSFRRHG
jgi:hypothetical protein